jgi:hypothetical protein
MGQDTCRMDDREALVNLAIYDYHEAVDQGESPDPAGWAARYPEIASELAAYFDDLARLDLLHAPVVVDLLGSAVPPGETVAAGTDSRPPTANLAPGDVLGDYVLLGELGRGGQGVVWKARPRDSCDILVALKTLRGPDAGDPASLHRLRAGVRAIARMKHEHIIRTFYFGADRGRWFFVMELMDGGTVGDRLDAYQNDPRSVAVLMEKVARAVHHAHTRNPGVIHLDLKPANILLTAEGEPKVADFELSVRLETIAFLEQHSATTRPVDPDEPSATFARAGIVGTLPYMSPEMAEGRWPDISTASDVYGLGAVLYEMLTGRPPFRGANARETRALVIGGGLRKPRELNRKVDRELNAVCLKCLDRDPGKRYGSADALANDLRRWLERRPTLVGGKPSVAREARFWVRRHPYTVALAIVIAFGLWVAGLAASVAGLRAENSREAQHLANQVNRELSLVRRATHFLAGDPRLRAAFSSPPSGEGEDRRQAIESFLKTAVERENLFELTGVNPLINVFVLSPDGVLLADTLPDERSLGKRFTVRDYYRAFFDAAHPRAPHEVYIARSFLSVKDDRYKIAVSTRVWGDHDELLGILVANLTIGPKLIDVDLRQEPVDAAILCPMDRSDPNHGVDDQGPHWPYIAVLDRRYAGVQSDRPAIAEVDRVPDFQSDSALDHATAGPWGGRLVDYCRVGRTHLVVVRRRPCPWPLSWLPEFR